MATPASSAGSTHSLNSEPLIQLLSQLCHRDIRRMGPLKIQGMFVIYSPGDRLAEVLHLNEEINTPWTTLLGPLNHMQPVGNSLAAESAQQVHSNTMEGVAQSTPSHHEEEVPAFVPPNRMLHIDTMGLGCFGDSTVSSSSVNPGDKDSNLASLFPCPSPYRAVTPIALPIPTTPLQQQPIDLSTPKDGQYLQLPPFSLEQQQSAEEGCNLYNLTPFVPLRPRPKADTETGCQVEYKDMKNPVSSESDDPYRVSPIVLGRNSSSAWTIHDGRNNASPSAFVDYNNNVASGQNNNAQTSQVTVIQQKKTARTALLACPLCPFQSSYKHSMTRHARTHARPTWSHCKFCRQQFESPHHLVLHIRNEHAAILTCSYCQKVFLSRSGLHRHFKQHQSDFGILGTVRQKPYYCTDCGKTFSGKLHLEGHRNVKHLDCKPYRCDTCFRAFAYWHSWRQHICRGLQHSRQGEAVSNPRNRGTYEGTKQSATDQLRQLGKQAAENCPLQQANHLEVHALRPNGNFNGTHTTGTVEQGEKNLVVRKMLLEEQMQEHITGQNIGKRREQDVEQTKEQDMEKRKDQNEDQREENYIEQRQGRDKNQGEEQDIEQRLEQDMDQSQELDLKQRPELDMEQRPEKDMEQRPEKDMEQRQTKDMEQIKEQNREQRQEQVKKERQHLDIEQRNEQKSEQTPEQDMEQRPEQDMEQINEQNREQKREQDIEQRPEQDMERRQELDIEQNNVQKSEQTPEQDMEQRPEQDMEQINEQNREQRREQDMEQRSEQDMEQRQEKDMEQRPEKDMEQRPDKDMEQRQKKNMEQIKEQRPEQDKEQRQEKDMEQIKEQNREQRPEQDMEQRPEKDMEQRPEKDMEQKPDKDMKQRPDKDMEQRPDKDIEQRQKNDMEQRPEQNREQRPEQDKEERQEKDMEQRQEQNKEQRQEEDIEQRQKHLMKEIEEQSEEQIIEKRRQHVVQKCKEHSMDKIEELNENQLVEQKKEWIMELREEHVVEQKEGQIMEHRKEWASEQQGKICIVEQWNGKTMEQEDQGIELRKNHNMDEILKMGNR